MKSALPKRKSLSHKTPPWVPEGSTFFITINCTPRGQNHLAIPAIASIVEESLLVRIEKGYWWPRLTLLMPDHIHTLMIFSPSQEMVKVISDWKRYLARHASIHWQRDFFDHRIRNEASLQEKWHYILQNPVRAGLVTATEHWPYIGFLIHLWITPFMLRLHPAGYAQHERTSKPARPERSEAKSKGEQGVFTTHLKKDPYIWINGIDKDGIGRDGSPSRPNNLKDGALGESPLPEDQ